MRTPHTLVDTVQKAIARHAMFTPGDRVIVGCSGGADSACLLHVLTVALSSLNLTCTAVYIDHGLRSETADERRLVARIASQVGATFECVSVDVRRRVQETGQSVQDAARRARYEALTHMFQRIGADRIAVGHTASDQAETVLLQLLRGAGPQGLAGIAPVRDMIVRPLIGVDRAAVESYCNAHDLPYIDDPSNAEYTYLRNRVRHELMPILTRLNPGVAEHLLRVADIFMEEETWLTEVVQREARALLTEEKGPDGSIWRLDIEKLRAHPLGLVRRILRYAYAEARGDTRDLQFTHVEQIAAAIGFETTLGRAVDRKLKGGTRQIGRFGGVTVVKEYDRLLFVPTGVDWHGPPLAKHILDVPGQVAVGSRGVVRARLLSGSSASPAASPVGPIRLDWDRLAPPIMVRSRRPGDRIMRPTGDYKKIKDVLIEAKVPRRQREQVPVIADQKGVLWVVDHAVSARAVPGPHSRHILELVVYRH